MTERTALLAMEALDKDRMAVQMTVHQITSIIYDYIPRACIREVEDRLFDAFFVNGVELTSNTMRKEYEEWKKLELNALMLKTTYRVQP